jgi:prevent-host-death family protein
MTYKPPQGGFVVSVRDLTDTVHPITVMSSDEWRGRGIWTSSWLQTILSIMIDMATEHPMITEVSAVNFRQNLGDMLNQVQYRNDSIVISKDGKPVAALVDAELFARIRRMQERFDALSDRIADAYARVPVEEGMAEIEAVVASERKRP